MNNNFTMNGSLRWTKALHKLRQLHPSLPGPGLICNPITDPSGKEPALSAPRLTAHKRYVWLIASITGSIFLNCFTIVFSRSLDWLASSFNTAS